MKIYLDVIFLENFIIDIVLINLTNKIMKLNANNKRIICSAVIGGLYSIIFYIPRLKLLVKLPFVILMACFIIAISINFISIKIVIKATSIFIGLSIMLTGICLFIIIISNRSENVLLLGSNTAKNIATSLLGLFCISVRVCDYIKERALVSNFIFQIKLYIDNKQYLIKAFLDTGNELREPITNLPCILVEKELIGDIEVGKDEVYFIPYSAVGIKGKLEGIKVNKVMIRQGNDKWREIKAIICLCDEKFSESGDFNALLSRGII